jgi:penicillin-binding protein 2
MAKKLGIGQTSGIPVHGESSGIIDGPEHLKETNPRDSWRDALSANLAIGQGAMLATPLQVAGVMEAIGNGGTLYWPRLVKSVHRPGDRALEQPMARVRTDLLSEGLTRGGIELVRSGLWKAVNEDGGTARKAAGSGLEVAGKTGTAQVWRITGDDKIADNNVWFAGFAPFQQPRYAFAFLVQGAKSGGGVAAPLAAGTLRRIEALREQPFVAKKLAPAKGDLAFLNELPK